MGTSRNAHCNLKKIELSSDSDFSQLVSGGGGGDFLTRTFAWKKPEPRNFVGFDH
jgi:hypothetical protein